MAGGRDAGEGWVLQPACVVPTRLTGSRGGSCKMKQPALKPDGGCTPRKKTKLTAMLFEGDCPFFALPVEMWGSGEEGSSRTCFLLSWDTKLP